MVEQVVAQVDDLKDGEMREVQVGEKKALLSRVGGQYYATSHSCPHYKAQLVKGTLSGDGRVKCPWHGACFSVFSGDIEDAPSLDALVKLQVKIEGTDVIVVADESQLDEGRRLAKTSCKGEDPRVFVVVGGGAAGLVACQTLRDEGFDGKIVMISKENYLPIERIKLSKSFKADIEKLSLKPKSYFTEAKIETKLGVQVVSLDKENKVVKLSDGSEVLYDSILLCTGGVPRFLWPESKHLNNIFTLRTADDANKIGYAVEKILSPNVVIVGSSFIGMEVASTLIKVAGSVTVIGSDKVPFAKIFGEKIGGFFLDLFESNNVKFKLGNQVEKVESEDGVSCSSVTLKGGEKIECDIVIVGAGVTLATDFLKGAIELEKDGSVVVDEYLQVKGFSGIYAAGDIARYPYHLNPGELVRIEHWSLAQQQGRVAAKNMLGNQVKFEYVPLFWTMVFGKALRFTGHLNKFDDVTIEGDIKEQAFIAYFSDGESIVAVASVSKDPAVSIASEAFRLGKMPKASEFKDGRVSILQLSLC